MSPAIFAIFLAKILHMPYNNSMKCYLEGLLCVMIF